MGLLDRFIIYHVDAPGQVRSFKFNSYTLLESIMETCNIVLIFKSLEETCFGSLAVCFGICFPKFF